MSYTNDHDKSVLLAMAMEWQVVEHNKRRCTIGHIGERIGVIDYPFNLYDPANMALAWRVVRWAFDEDDRCMVNTFRDWYRQHAIRIARSEDGQRILLDKIVELVEERERV